MAKISLFQPPKSEENVCLAVDRVEELNGN